MHAFQLSDLLPPIALVVVWPCLLGLIFRHCRLKLRLLKLLQASGTQATAHITDVRNYMAKRSRHSEAEIALAVAYEFQTRSGKPQKGRLRVLVQRLAHPEMFSGAPDMPVLYLENRPSVNILKDALAAKLVSAEDYYAKVKKLGGIGSLLLIAVLVCGLLPYL